MVCAVGSNSFASSSGVRPAFTSSTIWARNSAGYGVRCFAMVGTSYSKGSVSTKPGQLHFENDQFHVGWFAGTQHRGGAKHLRLAIDGTVVTAVPLEEVRRFEA